MLTYKEYLQEIRSTGSFDSLVGGVARLAARTVFGGGQRRSNTNSMQRPPKQQKPRDDMAKRLEPEVQKQLDKKYVDSQVKKRSTQMKRDAANRYAKPGEEHHFVVKKPLDNDWAKKNNVKVSHNWASSMDPNGKDLEKNGAKVIEKVKDRQQGLQRSIELNKKAGHRYSI